MFRILNTLGFRRTVSWSTTKYTPPPRIPMTKLDKKGKVNSHSGQHSFEPCTPRAQLQSIGATQKCSIRLNGMNKKGPLMCNSPEGGNEAAKSLKLTILGTRSVSLLNACKITCSISFNKTQGIIKMVSTQYFR